MNYYNDNDPFVIEWLKQLMLDHQIPKGDVDDRPIQEVTADDLRGYRQVHLFAGIGGWSLALQWAGWPEDRPIWTGSCPCQPFSGAGKQRGEADERHVWPHFRRLIKECEPPVVFGEQVASPLGRKWLSSVRTDLEEMGYGVGAADLSAAGVGAPHIRQRLWWVAGLAHPKRNVPKRQGHEMAREAREGEGEMEEWERVRDESLNGCAVGVEYLQCEDGKARPTQPGLRPLANGVPGRVGRLRGYGNAIVPQVGAVFVRGAIEAMEMERGG